MSLREFKYRAVDVAGATSKGVVRAGDATEAYRRLASGGLTPVSIREVRSGGPAFSWQRIKAEDVTDLTRELAVLVEAQIPLDRGLISIAESEGKPALAAVVRDLAGMIESGHSMSAAVEKHRGVFGDLFVESLRAGEQTGNLAAVMNHLSDLFERQQETRRQVRRALMYPAMVMSAVAAAVTVIVVFVVPKFAATFASTGKEMPLPTRIVQAVGVSAREHWAAYAGVLIAGAVALGVAWSRPDGRRAIERFLLRVPYVRKVILSVTAARFARVLSIALTSGLDLAEAVLIGGRATGRPVFQDECRRIADGLRAGDPFVETLRISRYVPPFARRMLGAGKDSREVAKACEIVARHYDREAGHLTKNINTIIEPLITVALAVVVLIIALAVFLPMWKMAAIKH